MLTTLVSELEDFLSHHMDIDLNKSISAFAQARKASDCGGTLAFAEGSSRCVLLIPKWQLVLKIPYTKFGRRQNAEEAEFTNESWSCEVVGHLDFMQHRDYISVSPLYEMLSDRFQACLLPIRQLDTTAELSIIDCTAYLEDLLAADASNDLNHRIYAFLLKFINQPPAHDLHTTSAIRRLEQLRDDDLLGFTSSELDELAWFDPLIENIGINEKDQVILVDSGHMNPLIEYSTRTIAHHYTPRELLDL